MNNDQAIIKRLKKDVFSQLGHSWACKGNDECFCQGGAFWRHIEPIVEQFILDAIHQAREEGERDGRNEYYFDSPDYLVDELYSTACTLSQRWNQSNYNNSMKSFKKEQTELSNHMVSLTKKLKNVKQELSDLKQNKKEEGE